MNEATFWGLLDGLDWRHQGDDEQVVAPVVDALARRSLKEIEGFQQILSRTLHALDGRAWAREMGSGWRGGLHPISADEFLYARCAVVANGREFHDAVLADPRRMPKDMEFEALLSIAWKAWEAKTGEEPGFGRGDVSHETFSNEAGWPPAEPEPEVPPLARRPNGKGQKTIRHDHGKPATRRLIRALITGDIQDPVLAAHLRTTLRVLVMTPGSGVQPPWEPDHPEHGPTPPWHARIELWTAQAGGTDPRPSGLVAVIALHRVSVDEVSAHLLSVEPE